MSEQGQFQRVPCPVCKGCGTLEQDNRMRRRQQQIEIQRRAYLLRQRGFTYERIVELLGAHSKGHVHRMVQLETIRQSSRDGGS